jgi:hypothetical protein
MLLGSTQTHTDIERDLHERSRQDIYLLKQYFSTNTTQYIDIVSVELQLTQDRLDQLVHDNHLLHAVRVLVQTEKTLSGPDLKDIQALSGMRDKLGKTKTYLQDTLTNELQNHLYLKNKSSLSRVGQPMYAPTTYLSRPNIIHLKEELVGSPTSDITRFAKTIFFHHDETEVDNQMVELDSCNWIQVYLEGLFHLGKLPDAILVHKKSLICIVYQGTNHHGFESCSRPSLE